MYQYNLKLGRIDTFFLCYSNLKDYNETSLPNHLYILFDNLLYTLLMLHFVLFQN